MSKKLDRDIIADNNNAISEAYNAIDHPHKFNAFVSVNYFGDFAPPLTFDTEAGILIDSLSNGMWIDFKEFEDRFYLEYRADYQVFKFYRDFMIIECESKHGDHIHITITPK